MQFIDHTGHVFSLPHYSAYPQGYEYEENPYVFWFKDEYASYLSLNCVYIQCIRPIIPLDLKNEEDLLSVEITIENSEYFRLLSSKTIQRKITESKNIFDISLDYYTDRAIEHNNSKTNPEKYENDLVTKLTLDDITRIDNLYKKNWYYVDDNGKRYAITEIYNIPEPDENGKRYYISPTGEKHELHSYDNSYVMLPFYVVATDVVDAGSWLTNVLITIRMADGSVYYCPITVGGEFVDEVEELVINGRNIGVSLPKDICRALYKTHFSTDMVDLSVWNQKMKEFMINHLVLKSERGNYRSAIEALKWFEWQDKVELSALVETDNEVVTQYILDKFDLNYDVINEFRYFRNSTLLNIYFKGVIEDLENVHDYDFTSENFYGEGKPYVINLFNKIIEKRYDEEDISFYRSYFDYTFNEIGLKLSALKYYYQKYFLPIHLTVYNASITYQTFANNIKFTNTSRTLLSAPLVYYYDKIDVRFPQGYNTIWLSEQVRYIDIIDENKKFTFDNSNWIEFNDGKDLEFANRFIDYHVFEICDNCFSVPITFIAENRYKQYNCVLLFYKDNKLIKQSNFTFMGEFEESTINFVIYPKMINKDFDINFWLDSDYHIDLLVNGKWYDYDFRLGVPELDIEMCKLKYRYDYSIHKQFNGMEKRYLCYNERGDKIYVSMAGENSVSYNGNTYDLIKINDETIYFNLNKERYYLKINDLYSAKRITETEDAEEFIDVEKIYNEESENYVIRYNDIEYPLEDNKFIINDIEYMLVEYKGLFTEYKSGKPLFNSYMYVPDLVTVSNINFIDEYIAYMANSHMYSISEDNQIFRDNIYYYFYDASGAKCILSSGKYILRQNKFTGKYQLVSREIFEEMKHMTEEEIEAKYPYNAYLAWRLNSTDNDGLIITEKNEKIKLFEFERDGVINVPDDLPLYSSVYKNIYNMLDVYKEVLHLPKNDNFYNRVHLFEIKTMNNGMLENIIYEAEKSSFGECIELNLDGIDILKFGDNDSELIIDLYEMFFDIEDGDWKKPLLKYDEKSKTWIKTDIEKEFYDFYLMHDNDVWYAVMISKEPISAGDCNISKSYKVETKDKDVYLKLIRSDEKFLVNRMELVSMNNVYHFEQNDMIVAKLNNYKHIPFKLIVGSKWTFTPLGIGSHISEVKESDTNFAILSIDDVETKHKKGYYSVHVSYSIDNFLNHNKTRETKILIK